MSTPISDHNLFQMEALNFDLATHYCALRLLMDVPDDERDAFHSRLLYERISVMSDTVHSFNTLENCIRAGRDFNAPEPDFYDDSSDWAEP